MNSKHLIAIGLVVLLIASTAGAYYLLTPPLDEEAAIEATTIKCLDMSDNEVEMPVNVESIAAMGAGTLRFASYMGLAEKICATDQLSGGVKYRGNPFMYAFDEFYGRQEVIDRSVPANTINLESVLTCNYGEKPDVLLVYDGMVRNNPEVIDSIKATGIPVFEVRNVENFLGSDFKLSEEYALQLTRMGKAFGVEDRANELIAGINAIFDEIRALVKDVPYSVYIGGLVRSKSIGMNISVKNYPSFELIGVKSILEDDALEKENLGTSDMVSLNVEKFVQYINTSEKFKVFIDPTSWRSSGALRVGDDLICTALCNRGADPGVIILPSNAYGRDCDNILVNCYIVAGEILGMDANAVRKGIDGVYELYYGKAAVNSDGVKLFDEISDNYYSMVHCKFGEKVEFGIGSVTTADGTVLKRA